MQYPFRENRVQLSVKIVSQKVILGLFVALFK